MGWSVRLAAYAEVNRLANRMRAADRREVGAFGHTPKSALVAGLRGSSMAWTAWLEDRPVAMFGITPASMIEGRGTIWLLGTDEVLKAARPLMRQGPHFLTLIHDDWPVLENYVAADNRAAVRLLEALGFDITAEIVIVGDVPMRRFSRGR